METYRPLYEGRSGIAAKYESHWLLAPEVREMNGIITVYITQLEIWGDVPDFGRSGIEFFLPGFVLFTILSGLKH